MEFKTRKKIILVGDKVLLAPDKESERTAHGLYLPPGVKEKDKVQSGYVIRVGPGMLCRIHNSWIRNHGPRHQKILSSICHYRRKKVITPSLYAMLRSMLNMKVKNILSYRMDRFLCFCARAELMNSSDQRNSRRMFRPCSHSY